jgi:hypothetical protein
MKKYLSISALVLLMMSLQACVTYVYGPRPGGVVVWRPIHRCCWVMSTADTQGSTTTAAVAQTATAPQDSAALLAQNYSISTASAQKIVAFAQGNDSTEIMDSMGITATDLAPLSDLEMPTQETIQTIATSLGEDSSKIEKVFADFVTDAKASN